MRVLVTGGSGFIGSHVTDKLKDRGIRVRVFDMVKPDFRDDIEFYQGSLLDFEAVCASLKGVHAIMHLAAVADVKDVFEKPHMSEAINTRGTENILEAARICGVKRIVLGSTTWVYSDVLVDKIDEDTPIALPSHLYTATKIAQECYVNAYSKLYGLETTILRYGIPYGPRARAGAVVPIFVNKALKGEPLTIAGDGLQYRKFVYVEDLAEGNVLGLKDAAKNRIYNLEGTEKVTIKQIAETVQKVIGNVEIKFIEGRKGDFSGKEISNKRAKEELGWEPKINFEQGVRKYVDWFKKLSSSEQDAFSKVNLK